MNPLAFRRIQAANPVGWSGAQPHTGFNELARAVARKLSPAGAISQPPVRAVPVAAELPRLAKAETERAALAARGDVTILTKPATEADPAAARDPRESGRWADLHLDPAGEIHDGLLAG